MLSRCASLPARTKSTFSDRHRVNHRSSSKRPKRRCRDETHSEVGTPHHAIAHLWRSHAGHTIHTANAEIPMSGATDKLVSTCRQAVPHCRHISGRFVNPFTIRAPPGSFTQQTGARVSRY